MRSAVYATPRAASRRLHRRTISGRINAASTPSLRSAVYSMVATRSMLGQPSSRRSAMTATRIGLVIVPLVSFRRTPRCRHLGRLLKYLDEPMGIPHRIEARQRLQGPPPKATIVGFIAQAADDGVREATRERTAAASQSPVDAIRQPFRDAANVECRNRYRMACGFE